MQPRASSLFHFTKSMEVLLEILRTGFWPQYCLEDIAWLGLGKREFVAYPTVCFCDIPLSRIDEHVAFYGGYGLGLTKEWGIKNGLNPVIYFAGSTPVLKNSLTELTKLVNELLEGDEKDMGRRHLRRVLAYSKPTSGRVVVAGEPADKEFYQETEWRYVPVSEKIRDYISEALFNDEAFCAECNEQTAKHCRLNFAPNDIRHIFVPTDAEIPNIINFIQQELDQYPASELKVLMSRITSLESLTRDV